MIVYLIHNFLIKGLLLNGSNEYVKYTADRKLERENSNREKVIEGYCVYHAKWGPICEIAWFQPAAHILGPSTAMANGVRINRDSIDRQA